MIVYMNETIIEESSNSFTMKGGRKHQKKKRTLSMPSMLMMNVPKMFGDDVFEVSKSPIKHVGEELMDEFYDAILDPKKYDVQVYDPAPIIEKGDNYIKYEKVYAKRIVPKTRKVVRRKNKRTRKTK
jgi:hypothetical protein